MCTPIHPLIHEGRTENPKWRFTSLFVHVILLSWWTKKCDTFPPEKVKIIGKIPIKFNEFMDSALW